MKKIFGKNQVIISALAIMIAVAGYLSITQDKAQKTANITNVGESAQNDAIYDISDEDTYNSDSYELTDTGDIIQKALATNSPSDASTAEPVSGPAQNDAKEKSPESTADAVKTSDISETSENVGKAVLVSSTIGAEYFDSAKLQREQTRSKNKEILMELINSTVATDAQKEQAVTEVINLTSDSEKENAAEAMLEAKGFGECMVSIVDGNVDVIVNANNLTDKEIAQVEDIVKRKTDAKASDIVITPVGVTGEEQ